MRMLPPSRGKVISSPRIAAVRAAAKIMQRAHCIIVTEYRTRRPRYQRSDRSGIPASLSPYSGLLFEVLWTQTEFPTATKLVLDDDLVWAKPPPVNQFVNEFWNPAVPLAFVRPSPRELRRVGVGMFCSRPQPALAISRLLDIFQEVLSCTRI